MMELLKIKGNIRKFVKKFRFYRFVNFYKVNSTVYASRYDIIKYIENVKNVILFKYQ